MAYKLNNDKVMFTALGDEGVLFDIEKNEYISLNETFFKILKYVEQGLEIGEMVKELCNEYDISEEDCRREVELVMTELRARKFLL